LTGRREPGRDGINISKRVVLLNSACLLATQVLNVGLLIWMQQFLLRRIAIDEYALCPLVYAPMILVNLVTAALTRSAGRFVVERVEHQDPAGITQVASTQVPASCFLACVVAVAGTAVVFNIDHVLTIPPEYLGDARTMFAMLVVLGVTQIAATPFVVGPYARQRFGIQGGITLATQLLRSLLIIVFLVFVEARVLWVVAATVAAELVGVFVLVLTSMRLVPELRFRFASIRWRSLRRYASFGGWSFAQEACGALRSSSVPVILNQAATPSDVSFFYLGALPSQNTAMLARTAVRPLAPSLVALHLRDGSSTLRSVYVRSSRYALWLASIIALPMMIYRRELITLYLGPEFLPVATVMCLLLTVTLIRLANLMLPDLSEARERVRPLALASFVGHSIALALILYLVVVRKQGAIGVGVASLTAALIMQPTVMWTLGRRRAEVRFAEWLRASVVPAAIPALSGAAVWLLLRWAVEPGTWLELGLCAAGGAAAFVACLLSFCLQEVDRKDLAAAIRALTSRAARDG